MAHASTPVSASTPLPVSAESGNDPVKGRLIARKAAAGPPTTRGDSDSLSPTTRCPCFIADWGPGGVDGVKASVEWAFVTWKAAPAGNFRSAASDCRCNACLGSSKAKDCLCTRFYDADRQDVSWKGMRGADVEIANDRLTLRANVHGSRASWLDYSSGVPVETIDKGRNAHTACGLAANADPGQWLWRAEAGVFDRSNDLCKARLYLLGVGYRIGPFTPMLTQSGYAQTCPDPADAHAARKFRTLSATLRYELMRSTALKVQLDTFSDSSIDRYNGSSRLLSVALDTVS